MEHESALDPRDGLVILAVEVSETLGPSSGSIPYKL